jgi:glycosyltransferase involved in cell wall biosynthesis
VREFVPAVARSAVLPGLPEGFRLAWVPPLYAAWQTVKLATRTRGMVGSWFADVTWLERGLLVGWPSLEPLLRRPLVLDVDDAIWLMPPFGRAAAAKLARRADVVIAGNAHIAEWLSPHARDLRVVPTAVDTRGLPLRSGRDESRGRLLLGWIGTGWNLRYLAGIATALGRFLSVHDAELLVVADRPPPLSGLPQDKLRFRRWSVAAEASFFAEVEIGLVPLVDDEWARGKCALKMLQCMACGVPVVASPVGVAREVLAHDGVGFAAESDDDWYTALEILLRNREERRRLGLAGRALVERQFSVEVVAPKLAAVFRSLA